MSAKRYAHISSCNCVSVNQLVNKLTLHSEAIYFHYREEKIDSWDWIKETHFDFVERKGLMKRTTSYTFADIPEKVHKIYIALPAMMYL